MRKATQARHGIAVLNVSADSYGRLGFGFNRAGLLSISREERFRWLRRRG